MTTVSGEAASSVVGTREFVDAMLAHTASINAEIERAAVGLAGAGITGPVLDGVHGLAGHYNGARGHWVRLGSALKQHESLAQLARATRGAAGDMSFYTDDTATAAGGVSEEIGPQWPGHKPPRRWEWKVSAHKTGDPRHVNYGLPSVDLKSEQALRVYIQDALQRYDGVELYHWYSGSELTCTRRPDGSVDVARRQLNPTAGAPGHRR